MADPLSHIKDSYYFEVPKALWRHDYKQIIDLPEPIQTEAREYRKTHTDEETLAKANHDLAGKILIPQPFGQLKSLYERESGFAISKFMVVEVIVAIVIFVIFTKVAKRVVTGDAPRGKFWNLFEVFLIFLRDDVARNAIGKHDADRFVPLLWTIFFFILGCNLMGMIPWVGAPTGEWGTTLAMAGVTFGVVLGAGMKKFGPVGFWLNQVPHMDLPFILAIVIKPVVFAIEVLGLLIKHVVLSIRLLANMVAGHLVILGIMGLILAAAEATTMMFSTVAAISVTGTVLFNCLELFVAFLQAYIFTFLSALFISAAVHHH